MAVFERRTLRFDYPTVQRVVSSILGSFQQPKIAPTVFGVLDLTKTWFGPEIRRTGTSLPRFDRFNRFSRAASRRQQNFWTNYDRKRPPSRTPPNGGIANPEGCALSPCG